MVDMGKNRGNEEEWGARGNNGERGGDNGRKGETSGEKEETGAK